MAIPLVAGGAALLGGLAAARAFSFVLHPLDSYIASQFAPADYARHQEAWFDQRCLLPGIDTIMDLRNKGMIGESRAQWAANMHGVLDRSDLQPDSDESAVARARLWDAARRLKQTVPDVSQIMDAWRRGWMSDEVARPMLIRAGADVEAMIALYPYLVEHPGAGEVIDSILRGRTVDPEAANMLKRAGADPALLDWYLRSRSTPLGMGEVLEGIKRGVFDPSYLETAIRRHGMLDPECAPLFQEMLKTLPGVSDLTIMGIREAFRPELGSLYDYYSEFPELTRPWFEKLGFNYPVGFEIPTQTGPRQAMMSDMAWAAHWHAMPLGSAYQAFWRFRPDRIADYQAETPGLKPFGINDLRLHMRLADLPPGVRDWMIALSHQPLSRMDIRRSITYSRKNEQWAVDAYLDLGVRRVDAEVLAHNAVEQQRLKDRAWITALEQQGNRKLVSITESLYRDGLIDRVAALDRLTQMGIPGLTASQLLDLQELDLQHSLITGAITATRRAFFSGEILAGDVVTQLGRFGVLPFRAQLFLQTWQIQFTQKRKRLETGKIAAMVVEGLMSADDAKQRLGNLGWSDPDATLLLAESAGKIAKRVAAEAKAGESAVQRRHRELERLAKQAQAQAKALRSEANRVAPRSVLIKWAKEGEIGEDSFRSMMRERGYPEGDIDLYWQEVVAPKPRKPVPSPKGTQFPKPPGSKHPMEGQLGKWYLTETIGRTEYVDALKSLGYSADDAERVAHNADLKHGKAGTTEEPPAPPPSG